MKTYNQDQLDALVISFQKIQNLNCTKKEELYFLFQLYSLFFESITDHQNISFTTLFSRIAFSSVHYNIKGKLIRDNHIFRRYVEKGGILKEDLTSIYKLGVYVLWCNINHVIGKEMPSNIERPIIKDDLNQFESVSSFQRIVKAYVVELEKLDNGLRLLYFDEEKPHLKQTIALESVDFVKQFLKLEKHLSLPVVVNLVDVNTYAKGESTAKAFVYKPDLLIGVTSISECFQSDGSSSLFYLAKKLLPNDYSVHMLVGNIVNFCLDELVHDSELNFKDLLLKIFQLAPLDFARLSDDELRKLLTKVELHFDNLKNVVKNELAETGITKDKAYLEPSFYSPEFGIQGRLDLYHFDKEKSQSDIIELKSGKLFKANGYGLNENHYVQTLLYDLIMESVYNGKVKSNNYILYSALDGKRLRYAPRVRSKQYKALEIRNDIVLLEDLLSDQSTDIFKKVLDALNPERIPKNYNFLKRDGKLFYETYTKVNNVEKEYYNSFLAFINREFQNSKIGRHGVYQSNGLASLWLDPMNEKIDNFRILSYLKIVENFSTEKLPIVNLEFTARSSQLSRFRIGDIAVFYPDDGSERAALRSQLFKCTIVGLNSEAITIRLRARQKNLDIFDQFDTWHLESDVLDSGFNLQLNGLYKFLRSPEDYKNQILGFVAPEQKPVEERYTNNKLTKEQSHVLNKAICSDNYFLLWGPPGTGKTSVMIRSFVDYYFNQTNLNIILLAYTNRAVDEICEAVDEVLEGNYIRIGSRYSTQDKFKNKLLSQTIDSIKSRRELQRSLTQNRVYVSTISSFQGRTDLTGISEFDLVIIDEASQLLEPMLVGFLSKFKKFILIGDHKQLPAVVGQDEEKTVVNSNVLLEQTNVRNMSTSLFERMYMQSQAKGWDWTYGGLSFQGRMHSDILSFISPNFYEGKLKVMSGINRLIDKPIMKPKDEIQRQLINSRLLFIDTPIGDALIKKTNKIEAEITAKLIEIWKEIYKANNIEVDRNSLGVITPFRSQIAMIGEKVDGETLKYVTLDTIERYQGGSRNQIIISLAVSQAQLLDSISNESSEGIDRKLNVALTRAKENIVIIGAKEILSRKPIYKSLIDYCDTVEYKRILDYN